MGHGAATVAFGQLQKQIAGWGSPSKRANELRRAFEAVQQDRWAASCLFCALQRRGRG